MKIRLSILFLISVLSISLTVSCGSPSDAKTSLTLSDSEETSESTALPLSEDMGQEYIDSLIFIGESTTYHMKSRGVLRGGTETQQIWAPKSGTLTLDATTKDTRIIYPPTGETMTFADAAAKSKPKYIVFTFGLNGAPRSIRLGKEYFKRCYLSLTDSIRAASPETVIILQSAFPVAENMDMSHYSVNIQTLVGYIETLNEWTRELSREENFGYLNTAEVLRGDDRLLRKELQVGDGYHLTENAYREILYYIRTHGYK